MKKLMKIMLGVLVLSTFIRPVKATGGVYGNTSSLNIVRGSTSSFRVTASNCAGKIQVYSTNSAVAKINVSEFWLDNDSATINVYGNGNGSAGIVVKLVDVSTYDGADISGTQFTVSINVYTPQSGDSSLASLEIEGLTVEPISTTEFCCYAPRDTVSVNIIAKAQSSKASISAIDGTVVEGWNTKQFTITAENGSINTYSLKIYVEEKPTVYYKETLGVVKNLDRVSAPAGFETEEITINEECIIIYNHSKVDLIYLTNDQGQSKFYLYNRQDNTVIDEYLPVIINNKRYLKATIDHEKFAIYDEQFDSVDIYIDGINFEGWKYRAQNMGDYRIIYLMDEEGETSVYSYCFSEKSIQKYVLPQYSVKKDYSQLYMTIGISAGAAGIISLIIGLIISSRKNKEN